MHKSAHSSNRSDVSDIDARRLVEAVIRVGDNNSLLSKRRQALLEELCQLVHADAGHWSWGRGHPSSCPVVPVAMLDHGYSAQQKSALIQTALDEATMRDFYKRMIDRVDDENQMCAARTDIYNDEEWQVSRFRDLAVATESDSWINAARYSHGDTWSNFHLVRFQGRAEFCSREVAIVNLALSSISWLHAMAEEVLPSERLVGLTSRRNAVLLHLLDGLTRKQIASKLKVTEHTVGDHIKAIYQHFGVHSTAELAAQFLRNG